MAKPELGAKRTCQSCGAKYYDLMRDPITCPRCGAAYVPVAVTSSAALARAARADAQRKKPVPAREDVVETADVEEDLDAITLEDADEEAAGATKKPVAADDDEADAEETDDDDENFLEPDEGDEDVTDIIGDREKDDEA